MFGALPKSPTRPGAQASTAARWQDGQPVLQNAGRLPSLDGLRALAIVLVVVGHGLNSIPNAPAAVRALSPIVGNGHLGVCLFFSLSGYLITHLLLRERDRRGGISLTAFYVRRMLRIFPAAYAYIATVAILAASGVLDVKWAELVQAALYVWNYSFTQSAWFLSHFWSLCLEEQFYLLWPALLAFGGRSRAVAGAVLIIAVMPVARVATYFSWPSARGHILIMAHTALDAMMYGCLAALLQNDRRFQRVLAALFRWRLHVATVLFLLVLSPLLEIRLRGSYYLPVGGSLNSAGCTLLILWALQNPRGTVGRWLNSRPFVHLGTISYSLYIWQELFLAPPRLALPWVGVFPLNEICALAAAEFSYWVIERPFLRLKGRLSDRAPTAEVPGRVIVPGLGPLYPEAGAPAGSPDELRR